MEFQENIHNDVPARSIGLKKLMIWAGLALCPLSTGILVLVAGASEGPGNTFFVGILYLLARISALLGIATILVAYFLALVTGWGETRAEESREELVGRPAGLPQSEHANFLSGLSPSRLDLRGRWSPFLMYILCFAAADIVFYVKPMLWKVEWQEAAEIARVGNFIAIFMFSYFWFAGIARLHRVGHEITRGHYTPMVLAQLVFWGTFIVLHG